MKKILIISLIILVLAVIAFLRFSSPEDTWLCENGEWIKHGNPSEVQPVTSCVGLNDKQLDSDRIVVEKYIRDNIKNIVSEKPVLGGSWYVTLVDINPLTKTGTMTYEDGHIQGSKSFSYIRNDNEVKINLMDSILSEAEARVIALKSGVEGVVSIGPTCPVERFPPDPNCADRPYATSIQVISIGSPKSSPFTTIESDKEGKYKIMLPPGEYALQPVGGSVMPRCETKNITIEPSKIIKVNLSCDSGIR